MPSYIALNQVYAPLELHFADKSNLDTKCSNLLYYYLSIGLVPYECYENLVIVDPEDSRKYEVSIVSINGWSALVLKSKENWKQGSLNDGITDVFNYVKKANKRK